MTDSQATLAHAQRVYDEVNTAVENPALGLTKLPALSKYLVQVLLQLASNHVRLVARVHALEKAENAKNR